MRNNSTKNPRYFIHSLGKGLDLLQILAKKARPLTLAEIAHAMGTNNTTVTRLCYTLSELEFIQRDQQKRYRLSPKVLTLGYGAICGSEWREVAKYYLERLFTEVQETVSLSILQDSEILYLIRLRKRQYLPFNIRVGTTLPVYCTAMGKVLMAMGPPEKTVPVIEKLRFRRLAGRTITHLDKFLEELGNVRKKGYAINDEELTVGNRAVAAPVVNGQGYAIAAINIATPTTQYSRKEMEKKLAPLVMRTAQDISGALQQIATI
jgi:IclR family pca regulon transcriptional regulator